MKKYYVIKIVFDDGFWSEEHQDFKGWLYATKYESDADIFSSEAKVASQKKPITILEVYDHE